jgi:serine/threonine-protein kinase
VVAGDVIVSNARRHAEDSTLPVEIARRVDEVCDRFEKAWKAGARPRIEDYVTQAGDPDDAFYLLRELLLVELDYRHGAGERLRLTEYQARFPSLPADWLQHILEGYSAPTAARPAANGQAAGARSPLRIRCPHCHNPLQLADERRDQVLCPGCGSSFRIQDGRATTAEVAMQLGKFRLLERVGGGAFADVWRAYDTELKRLVALKIPSPRLLSSRNAREAFLEEARNVSRLRHPDIVTVHEVTTLGELPAIVYEYVQGVSLRELLRNDRLTFQETAALVAQVARALDYAHAQGVIHRDVKPANLMIEVEAVNGAGKQGGVRRLHARVVDFGLALRQEVEITLTAEGRIIGTPAYMPPEQAAGLGHQVDRRGDVYSLGVILYELLCGELPFRGSIQWITEQILHQQPRPLREINDRIPRDLEILCLKCLHKSPESRFNTAGELADELQRYLDRQPIHTRPPGPAEAAWRWCRRVERIRDAGVFTLVLALLLTLWSAWGLLFFALGVFVPPRPGHFVAETFGTLGCLYLPLAALAWGTLARKVYALWIGLVVAVVAVGVLVAWHFGLLDFDVGGIHIDPVARLPMLRMLLIGATVQLAAYVLALLAHHANRTPPP